MKNVTLIIITAFAISGCWWVYHNTKVDDLKLSHLNDLKQRDSIEVYLNYQNFVRDSLIYDIDVFIQNEKIIRRVKQHYFQNR
jgi:hypothetical protein